MTDEATTPTRDAWREALRRFAEGDPRARIDVPAQDPDIETLRTIVNEALDLAEVRYGILHDSVMEIAVGMSDVYDTLHAFRHGDMSRRVGTETVASSEGLMGQLGSMINELLEAVTAKDLGGKGQ